MIGAFVFVVAGVAVDGLIVLNNEAAKKSAAGH